MKYKRGFLGKKTRRDWKQWIVDLEKIGQNRIGKCRTWNEVVPSGIANALCAKPAVRNPLKNK